MRDNLRILIIEPKQTLYEKTIKNSLAEFSKIVGGNFEIIDFQDNFIVYNKNIEFDINNYNSVFFIVGNDINSSDFKSLTEIEIENYITFFSNKENDIEFSL